MAELDDKLLKNLDKTLESMNQRLQGLEQTLAGVKEGMMSAFNPAIIKSFTDSMRGLKAIRLIEADEAVKDIKKIKDEIDSLESKYKGEKPLKKGESLGSVREELSRYKALMREIDKGSEQRAIELANIRQKERDADLKSAEVVVSQREQAERRKAEIARAWAEQEAREKAQREKMKTAAEKAAADERTAIAEAEAKKKSEIAKAWAEQDRRRYEKDGDPLGEIAARKGLTGTLAALEDQTAVNEWRKQTAEEQKRIAKEEAEVEKQIKKEIAEEEKKLAAEEKQRYQDAVAANKAMTKAEDDLAEAKRKARTAESKAAYTEDTKQRIEEEKKAARERAQQAKEAAAIQKKADAESMANQRRQIQIKSQLAAIDKNRIAITKQSSEREKALAAQQQADYRSLQSELSKLIARQKELNAVSQGSGRRAKDRLSTYTISESEKAMRRYADAVRNAHREQKKLGDETNKMLPTIQRLASAFGVAFSVRGLAQFGKKLIETRGEFERQQVALRSILQNKQLADEIWDKTMQAALQSPFTAMQLTTYTKQLAAYRIETDKLFDTTKRLADVSAGLGVDMQRLILAYGQVKAANYLRASEIRQFTEAGVNVLGELRDYFNDVKGMSVDTAQVMEMVTKRLVTFEDVEAIFKRMTDQGGIFYEMQYVQSQTVRGQIAKLHDAYDQMLNSIGQANEGVLKNMVSLLNSIVKNWQEFKTVIDLIAWPLLISFVYKFSRGLMTTAASAVATSASMNKLTVAGAKTQLMFKRLFASIAAHPFIALGAAVAAVGVALLNHAKHVRDINKRYEDLMLRTYETQKNLNGLSETIQNNLDTMKEAAKGSEAYNEASRENENIVKKLKDQYPELLQDIDLQKDGYEKLIEKIKEYNEELENNIRLEYAARAGFWQDDLTTNIADLQEAQRKREMQFLQNRELAERRYLELKAQGKEAEEDIWNKRIRLAKDWQEQVDIINQQNEAARGSQNPYGEGISIGDWSLQMRGFVAPIGDVERNKANLSSNIKQEALVFNDIIRDQLKTINEDLGDDIQQFITDNETQINELFKDKEGAGWKLLNKQITKFFTAKGATDKETREAIQNFLNEYLLIPIQLDWDNIGGTSGSTTPPQTSGNKTKENASKLISLIKEMRGEYDKLSKSAYGYAKSEEKVREAYKDSVKEILGKAGITDYDFTTNEGMIKALEKVKSYATKLGKDAAAEVQKYIDQLETEIEINAQVRIREDFGRQIEDMFNNYELTLELQKLNIPADAAKDLFPDFTEKTLGDLQKLLREFYEGRQKKDEKGNVLFSEEDLNEYRKWADKIDNEILKERKEKAKEYSKYLEKEYSERAKLEMQHAKDVAFVTANVVDGNQRDTILANINKKYQDDLNELKWKSFKESSFYVDMMDDIASLPAEYTRMMLDKINEILEHPEKLSPRALKEAVNARQKVIEAQIATKPLTVMTNAGREIREARKLLKQDEEITVKWWESTRRALDKQIKTEAESIAEDEKKINSLQVLQGELAGYERLLENLKEATSKVDNEGLNNLMGLDLGESVSELSPEEIESKIEDLKTLLDSQRSLYDATEKTDEQNARAVEIKQIETLIKTLRDELEARKALASFNLSNEAQEARSKGETSSTIGSQIAGFETSKEGKQKRLTTWKEYLKQFNNFSEAFADFNKNLNDVLGKVRDMGNAWYDMFDALGGETNVLTDGWKEFGNTITDVFTQTLTLIPQMIVAFQSAGTSINASLGVIGLIAEAVQLVFAAIGAFAKLHDARYEREIEIQQKKIDDLQRAYDRLEKSIEKAFDTVSYIREYNQEVQNLNEQYEALANQIDAEKAKKNVDEDKLQDYADKQQEIIDNLEEIKQEQIEVFGGIGEDGYRDAAQGFVDAWKSAFLETGDGLQGLQDHFDEFLNDWFVKQATMRYASAALEPVFKMIDDAVSPNGAGGANVLMQELENIKEWARVNFPQISDTLEEISRPFIGEGEGSLSGLAAGIQGMTEEQANILEAYWNSVRGYTASIDMNVSRIAQILGAGGDSTNPQLQQLTLIAANTQATHQLLQSVTKSGHSQGGYGIKVFAD